jgi:hypothetical protein
MYKRKIKGNIRKEIMTKKFINGNEIISVIEIQKVKDHEGSTKIRNIIKNI